MTDDLPPACIGGDPACPRQDGAACHYRDAADGTKRWPIPVLPLPDSAREAMRTALEQLEHINRCIGLGTATIHYGSATWADTEAAIDALRAALGDE